MKKTSVLILLVTSLMCLSGCSAVDNVVNKMMYEKSGIYEDENYKTYQEQKDFGYVGEDGFYQEQTIDASSGSVVVSFATNNNLEVRYYSDSSKNGLIDNSLFYANPGDTLYADVEVSKDVSSSMYDFSSLNIYGFDDKGDRYLLTESYADSAGTLALTLPTDYKGTELLIEPVGRYLERRINLDDYYVDDNGQKFELDGTWLVNDEVITADYVEINPVSAYIISYEYDSNEYFYSASNQEEFYSNNEDGIVIFPQRKSTDETVDYSVELRKYLTVNITSGVDRIVRVNNGLMQSVKQNDELELAHLKYGDTVTIETNREWSSLETVRDIILTKTEPLSTGSYKYTLIVPEKDGQFAFDPNDYQYEHGTLTFKCFGSAVDGVQYLAKDSKIYYEQKTAEEGYWLAPGDHYVVVGEEEETRRRLSDIHFIEMVQTTVYLNQPDFGGKIDYFLNGTQVRDTSVLAYSGDVISMNFEPWEGWDCSPYKDGDTFTVPNSKQSVNATIDGKDVKTVFKEDPGHKPALTVVLEKNLGQNMQFEFEASGLDKNSYSYVDGWFRNDYKIIDGRAIGTEKPILISVKNAALQPGKAVKIEIKKNKDITAIRYIDDLTKLEDPIYIYNPSEAAKPANWYNSIDITISMVDVLSFTAPTAGNNTYVTVKNADTMQIYKAGDLIMANQNVIVTISPVSGYYIDGGNTTEKAVYQETLKYSNYLSKIDKMINDHYARKIYTVTLGTVDSYATYSYKYDGKIVSGTVQMRDGYELTLDYEIINSTYKMTESSGGFMGIGASDTKTSKTIVITSDMDGTTIDRATFGICVTGGN